MADWATRVRGALGRVVRRTGNGRMTRPAFVAGYELTARLVSGVLADVPGTSAVYLAGSLVEPESVAPGVSDIDLLLVAALPTCEAELRFRAALKRRFRVLGALAPVLYNLEYLDAGDAPYLSAFGNAWIAGFPGSFRRLRGTPLHLPRFERPPAETACEQLVHLLAKWRKTGCHLLDPRLEVEPWVLARSAERMHASAAAARPEASGHGPPRGRRACLEGTLEILERLSEDCTGSWDGTWRIDDGGAAPSPPSEERARDARVLHSHGFASVYVVPHGPDARAHRVVAVGAAGEPASAVVARAERAFVDLPPARADDRFPERPVILTRRLWDAGALLEPSPFTGAHVASGRCQVLGEALPAPKAPAPEALRGLLRARTTDLFRKPRARLLRVGKARALERLADDLRLAPALSAALDTGVLELGPARRGRLPDADSPEPVLFEALRAWIEDRRKALAPELERRTVFRRP